MKMNSPKDRSAVKLLKHIELRNGPVNCDDLFDQDQDYAFTKLLRAINMRASTLADQQPNYPKMDLSALYCLGITMQEYLRHLSTSIIQQKRTATGMSIFDTLFTKNELENRQLDSVIYKYKENKTAEKIIIPPRPNLKQELSFGTRRQKRLAGFHVQVRTSTTEETEFEKMLRKPEWKSILPRTKKEHSVEDEEAKRLRKLYEAKKRQELKRRKQMAEKELRNELAMEQTAMLKRVKRDRPPLADIFDAFDNKKLKKTKMATSKKRQSRSIGF